MTITVRENKDVVIFDIEGEFKRSEIEARPLSDLVKVQLDNQKRKFLINLEKITFMDSFGIGEILASYICVRNKNGILKRAAFPRELYLVPDPLIDFTYESVEAALESFESAGMPQKKW